MYTTPDIKQYFLEEMSYLRQQSVEFGEAYPDIAQELTLNADKASDPQVEMLLQSFAYLSGRVRYQMELDSAQLPNQLLAALCPHLECSWPATSIVQFETPAKKMNLKKGTSLNTDIATKTSTINCRFRTCYDSNVLPLEVVKSNLIPLN